MSYVVSQIGKHAGEVMEMPHHVAQTCVEVQGTHRWATEDDIKAAGKPRPEGERPMIVETALPPGYGVAPDPVAGWHVIDPGGVPLTVDPLENVLRAREFAWAHYNDIGAGRIVPVPPFARPVDPDKAEAAHIKAAEAEIAAKRAAQAERMDRYGVPSAPRPAEDAGPHRERVPHAQPGSDRGNPKPAHDREHRR